MVLYVNSFIINTIIQLLFFIYNKIFINNNNIKMVSIFLLIPFISFCIIMVNILLFIFLLDEFIYGLYLNQLNLFHFCGIHHLWGHFLFHVRLN